jgi:hypothetical protein
MDPAVYILNNEIHKVDNMIVWEKGIVLNTIGIRKISKI